MLFKRRHDPPFWERLRVAFWPRRSWNRSVQYVMLRLNRLSGTAHTIALGAAVGVFISFTPFMGLHFILAGVLAYLVGGNILASALGTFVGNPITFPFIWATAYKSGHFILGNGHQKFNIDLLKETFNGGISHAMTEAYATFIKPMTLGGAPFGMMAAFIGYFIFRKLIESYQYRRRHKREMRYLERMKQ